MPASRVAKTARAPSAVERLRQQFEQRHAEQRADRVADEPGNQPLADALGHEQQGRGDREPPEPAEETQADRDREEAHAPGLYAV